MSFVNVVAAVVAVVGAVSSADQSRRQNNTQRDAQMRANAEAKKQMQMQDQENNRLNRKTPDMNAMQQANADAAKLGGSGTMLTGTQGAVTSPAALGKTTLLGA